MTRPIIAETESESMTAHSITRELGSYGHNN
jgi:hypothetical protein